MSPPIDNSDNSNQKQYGNTRATTHHDPDNGMEYQTTVYTVPSTCPSGEDFSSQQYQERWVTHIKTSKPETNNLIYFLCKLCVYILTYVRILTRKDFVGVQV